MRQNGKWHIDHIRPCASFTLRHASHQRACFHYTNLQPLWARENLRKGSLWRGRRYAHGAAEANDPLHQQQPAPIQQHIGAPGYGHVALPAAGAPGYGHVAAAGAPGYGRVVAAGAPGYGHLALPAAGAPGYGHLALPAAGAPGHVPVPHHAALLIARNNVILEHNDVVLKYNDALLRQQCAYLQGAINSLLCGSLAPPAGI